VTRRENRFVKYWLAPIVLVVVAAGMTFVTLSVQNSWWVDRDRPPSSDQLAADGTTALTQAGLDYAYATGVLIIRVGDEALPAEQLGLDRDGERRLDADVPLQVRLLAPEGPLVLDLMDTVVVTTEDDRITRLEITPWGGVSYREFIALLQSRADTIGWTADDLQRLEDDLGAAQREREGETYSATLAGGDATGATVSVEVTVDLAASWTSFTFTVEP
jgi:hypothetical protein